VTSVGYRAFQECTGLTTVISLNPTPQTMGYEFNGVDMAKVCLHVPSGSIDAYRSADGWKEFSCIKDVASR